MSDWREVRLGEVVRQSRRAVGLSEMGTYPLLGVRWYGEGAFLRETVGRQTSKASRFFEVSAGQFIYNRLFAGKGAFALVPPDLDGSFVSNEFPLFDTDANSLDPSFLRLIFQQPSVWSRVEVECTGTTSSRSRWVESRFLDFQVALPPLTEQRRIVDLISALDLAAQAMDAEAGGADVMLSTLRSELLDPLGGVLDLPSVMSQVRSGGTPNRKRPEFYGGAIPWLKSGEVASAWIEDTEECITEEGLAASSAWRVPAGAVVVAMYGATAAEVGYLGSAMSTNQAVLALVPDDTRCDGRFAYHWFCHHSARLKSAASGAAQPNLSKSVILREVAYPDLAVHEQTGIAQILDDVLALRDRLKKEALGLRLLRSATLHILLAHHLDIPPSYDALLESA